MPSRWKHVTPITHNRHYADPHYTADGKWICHTCHEPIKLREPRPSRRRKLMP